MSYGPARTIACGGGPGERYRERVIRTRFSEMFGLTYPVMSAPMALHSGGSLAGAVSAAGGLGTFGGITLAGPEWVLAEAAKVRDQTDRPFGIGFITPFLDFAQPLFDAAVEADTPVIVLSFSDPTAWVERTVAAGARAVCQVQTIADADESVEAGAHVLVVQGNEAGGHTGHMALLPFLAAVVRRHPNIPVLAAGGIADGATMSAAMVGGADGVLMGTAFMATPEVVEVNDVIKQAIVASDGSDTVFTRAWDVLGGLPWPESIGERVLANSFTDRWNGREEELAQQREDVASRHAYATDTPDTATDHIPLGPAAGLIDAVRPAAELMERVCSDAERILRTRPASLLG